MLFNKKPPVQPKGSAERVVGALKELQETLHLLTPAEQSEVRRSMPFASSEWLDGLQRACRSARGSLLDDLLDASTISVKPHDANEARMTNEARLTLTNDTAKLVIILVGLPARGKSLLGHKLEQFLGWRGYITKGFRVGAKRRELAKEDNPAAQPSTGSASFFDATKAYAAAVREMVSIEAFGEAMDWLSTGGQVAIFDASNVQVQRRAKLLERVRAERAKAAASGLGGTIGVVFLESIVTDEAIIKQGMDFKIKHSADFRGMEPAAAYKDLVQRIKHYEKIYETVRPEEGAYIKLYNLGATAHCKDVYGRMSKSVLLYLLSLHSYPRSIYMLTVPACGLDSSFVAGATTKWLATCEHAADIRILTTPRCASSDPEDGTKMSAYAVALELASAAGAAPPAERAQLAPLPSEAASRSTSFRFLSILDSFPTPHISTPEVMFVDRFGEKMSDLVAILEPIVLEIEASTHPMLIIAHEASMRALRAYLLQPRASDFLTSREIVDSSFHPSPKTLVEFFPSESGGMLERTHDLHAL
jgi:predicted kinase